MFRLAPQAGEVLDRARSGSFEFEGRRIDFLGGDTYGSALAASGAMTLAHWPAAFELDWTWPRTRALLCHRVAVLWRRCPDRGAGGAVGGGTAIQPSSQRNP